MKKTDLSVEEYQKVIIDWNQTAQAFPTDKTIHQLFEEQAKQTPNDIAVEYQHHGLSYKQLDEKSNQLARCILKQTAGENKLIAVCMDRSPEMIMAILGILKAGCAYVPIDPNYPLARIKYILEDSKSALLLTQIDLFIHLQSAVQSPVLVIDERLLEEQLNQHVGFLGRHSDLAYVIYTSGTTGQPKGVMIEHRSVVNYVSAVSSYLAHDVHRFDFSTNLAFDLSVTSTIVPLLLGKTIIIFRDGLENAAQYIQHLQANHIDFIKTTPSYFSQALSFASEQLQIKQCFLGGEPVTEAQLAAISQHVEVIYDEYGPTETTVGVTAIQKNHHFSQCIGKPYPNCMVYVLDEKRKPVSIGEEGELYIGGICLARGYLNQPELTHERFIPNPFAEGRMYKSGDLVKWLPDGTLEYIGRSDFQVKIRGYRIELGEIESTLVSHPEIKQCAVLVHDAKLIAYYVGQTQENLADYLSGKLPEYMIPVTYISLEAFPLTSNGKLDRDAFPLPDVTTHQSPYVAPRNPLEQVVVHVWQSVLGLKKIGIDDDFFKLGGDSIQSIQISAALQRENINCRSSDIFTHHTIARLADSLSEMVAVHAEQGLLSGAFELLPLQQWFFAQQFKRPNHWNQSFIVRVPELSVQR